MSELFDLIGKLFMSLYNEVEEKAEGVVRNATDEQLKQAYKKHDQNNNETAKKIIRKEMKRRAK